MYPVNDVGLLGVVLWGLAWSRSRSLKKVAGMMLYPRGLADLTDHTAIGVTTCDPTTDNACLLQQDAVTLQQQAQAQIAAAIVAAQQAANPPASSGLTDFLLLAALAAAGYFAWKSGALQNLHFGGVQQA